MRLLVSIHDVTPAYAYELETLWDICAAHGITPALLVVPSWHGNWALEDDSRFCGWLRRCEKAGAEIFLHGERHDEAGAQRTFGDELRAMGRTAGEAEFLTLNRLAARNRIARGLRRLRHIGLHPIGFVAPAWLWRRDCARVVADLGLHYSEDTRHIYLHDRAMRVRAPVIRWSARGAFRTHMSVVVAAVARAMLRDPLIRVALHPADIRSRPVRRSLLRTLDAFRLRAWPIRYGAI